MEMSPADYQYEEMVFGLEQAYDEYATLRAEGYDMIFCAQSAFGFPDGLMDVEQRSYAIERNAYTREKVKQLVNAAIIEGMWDFRTAVFELLKIARDRFSSDAAKMAAIKELNFIANIQPLKREVAKIPGFQDFYASQAQIVDATAEDAQAKIH